MPQQATQGRPESATFTSSWGTGGVPRSVRAEGVLERGGVGQDIDRLCRCRGVTYSNIVLYRLLVSIEVMSFGPTCQSA